MTKTKRTHRGEVHLGRRDILRGLGAGAALLAPFARAAVARAAGKTTPRLMVFYTPNGHVRSAFGGSGSGAAFTLKPSLMPLEAHKANLAIVSNVDNPGSSTKASHEDCVRTLTCVPGGDIYRGYGTSLDWAVANHLGVRPMTMSSLWKGAPNWQTKISWKSDGVFDPHIDDAMAIYTDVFAKVVPAAGAGDAEKLLAQGKSVLDFVRADIQALQPRLAAADRAKLGNHLDALRDLEAGLGNATASASCSTLAPLKTKVDAGTAGAAGGEELKRAIEIKVELAATAFACGTRRVATLLAQGASAGRNPFGNPNHHDISHYQVPNAGDVWKQIDRWYAERFASVLARMAAFQILDETVVVWATEISEEHSQKGFVIPVAGGRALGMQLGQAFTGKDTLSNIWVSVQRAMGLAKETFGTGSSGGIPGLWKPV